MYFNGLLSIQVSLTDGNIFARFFLSCSTS